MNIRPRPSKIITFMSDFGLQDTYVAEVKGVLLSSLPDATIVDITHLIPAYDIMKAARLLERSFKAFPRNTIHLAIVDPGVGSERQAVIIRALDYWFVGPDNGLFNRIAEMDPNHKIYKIPTVSKNADSTFQGRDLFAPAIVELVLNPRKIFSYGLGTLIGNVAIPQKPIRKNNAWLGQILHIDHFGNLETNFSQAIVAQCKSPAVKVQRRVIHTLVKSFAEAPKHQASLLINSYGRLEIIWPNDSAQKKMALECNQKVKLFDEKGL